VTYVIKGEVHHEDSTGIKGIINSGDLQWMTAGSGIFHAEMPKPIKIKQDDKEIEDPENRGLQLWINLPSRLKMTKPLYISTINILNNLSILIHFSRLLLTK